MRRIVVAVVREVQPIAGRGTRVQGAESCPVIRARFRGSDCEPPQHSTYVCRLVANITPDHLAPIEHHFADPIMGGEKEGDGRGLRIVARKLLSSSVA
jgi:hypothetical protein